MLLDRRTFMHDMGLAALTVYCVSHEETAASGAAEAHDLAIHSGPGLFRHVHDLLIPSAALRTPPVEGIELVSTEAFFHRHRIPLTREELVRVGQGGAVTKKASSHIFLIALASRQGA